jgi:uncharacterized membrane protein (DUF373 family)
MNKVRKIYNSLLQEDFKEKCEKIIVIIAIISFLVHLTLIFLSKFTILEFHNYSKLFTNPIAAIYTPFSFILIYEVYLLIYYLPKSTSIYIGKQYEIILLIIIRRIFKDMSNLQLSENWFSIKYDILFIYDIIAVVLLFFLIYWFYKFNADNLRYQNTKTVHTKNTKRFIQIKKNIATLLVPTLFILSLFSFGKWIYESFFSISNLVYDFKDVNNVFFDDFFTILILVDVFLLLFSFLHSDEFSVVIRNSGFIISTIMIKLSFGAEGLLNVVLVTISVIFGIIILWIHNKFQKIEPHL